MNMMKNMMKPLLAIVLCAEAYMPCIAETENSFQVRDRMVFGATAISPDTGERSATGYAAGLWDINYTINQNVTVGTYVNLPFYVIGAFPHITFNTKLNENWHAGAGLITGTVGPYVDNPDHYWFILGGGHVAVTGLYGRHMFNFNTTAFSALWHEKGEGWNDAEYFIVFSGYRIRLCHQWRLVLSDGSVTDAFYG